MVPKAVIVGGTGQIGLATARRMIGAGWDVTVVSRHVKALPDGCRHVGVDGRDVEALSAAVSFDTDLLLSCVAFDTADAECLVQAGRAVGRIVAISSASVYCDAEGRTLDEASVCGFPVFSVPLTEQSLTVAPGPETYSTRKVAMENTLLSRAACPVTILRPCAIHGPESKHAREWWFVKRLLDGQSKIPLAYGGCSRFQTTSVAAIADAVVRAAGGDLPAVANVSDADSPTVAEIGRAIMDIMGMRAELIGLPDAPLFPPALGATPWSIPRPMIFSGAATAQATYAQSAGPAVRWLVEHVGNDNWRTRLPQLATYPTPLFDYEADDRAFQLLGAGSFT
ncbi:NAD-dependent epimerase/dehydratase family protein [Bosea sp. 2KB_26]|uniref:NAD-dependent epimerase/dehydratase family protein n=1 Tax=Bosea sp. 2KB_26 TaxID=3237475 RepID=UPI003F90AA12